MTTVTAAELCGHRWPGPCARHPAAAVVSRPMPHRCAEPADHPPTTPHTCRCGATTTREDTR